MEKGRAGRLIGIIGLAIISRKQTYDDDRPIHF